MNNNSKWLIALLMGYLVIFISYVARAHGEATPGPHGGVIRMPGAFHTEVVPGKDKLDVYLLDMDWRNPVTKDSSVVAIIKVNSKSHGLDCKTNDKKFVCLLPQGTKLDKGELSIKASRSGTPGIEMKYKLPLNMTGSGPAHH